jgi:8-oxo-dGTP pyrophosphatase MutT (NUDIX family)
MSSRFERTGSETLYEGPMFAVRRDKYRHEDGEEVTREIVSHPGAVGVVVLDGDRLWLVRQPREAVDSPDMLEIPAGKLDEDGEDPRQTAERELAEEIGKRAGRWDEIQAFYTSPGFSDERVWLFLATDLADTEEPAEAEEDERIDIVPWSLDELDAALAESEDSKTLIALLWLGQARARGGPAGG